jgi:cytochrome P450
MQGVDAPVSNGLAAAARTMDELPGPPRLPVLGNAHQMRFGRLHLIVEDWCDRYGPIFRFSLGRHTLVVVDDLDEVHRILRDRPDGFRRGQRMKAIADEMGNSGVFSEEGDVWRRQRRLVVTALNTRHVQRYFHIIHTATDRLHHRLRNDARDGATLEIGEHLMSYSLDVVAALALGHDLNTLENGEHELQHHIERVFAMTLRRLFMIVPYWHIFRLPADRALDWSMLELDRAVGGFIEQARERVRENPALLNTPENLLEAMLATQHDDPSFTNKEIIANAHTLLNAGQDTTSNTMAWTVWFLASRPEIQERWANEARELLGEQPSPADPDTVDKLPYGEAVLRESMRLKPVTPCLGAETRNDETILGTHVPAGTRVWLPTRRLGLNAVTRGTEYHPERWLASGDGGSDAPDQRSFLTFGAGPRFCPGRNLAFLSAKTALAMIARNFRIELDESDGPVSEQFALTMVPKGLRVRLHERTNN